MHTLTLHSATPQDYDALLRIWEASVRHTHHFLSNEDISFFRKVIVEQQVFDQVTIVVAKDDSGTVCGFAGVADGKLEMLFVSPEIMGKGAGKMLLRHAVDVLAVVEVDVNEQNEDALEFYQRFGFRVVDRSPLDSTGKPFPIVHMRLMQ